MRIFCSGIGGIGLSAYAAHMHERGHSVSGSDASSSHITDDLVKMGISVSLRQDGSAIPENTDVFVFSEAIPEHAPERCAAREKGIPEMSYFRALGKLTENTFLICIAGTHGKSSTTAMLSGVLIDAGKDPNVVLGTKSPILGGRNWRRGQGNLWVVEACEYRTSFLSLSPTIILLTNADGDHFDAFQNHTAYKKAFVDFLVRLPSDGVVIHHASDADAKEIVSMSSKNALDADNMPLLPLSVPGVHMKQNAQLVQKAAEILHIDSSTVEKSLCAFSGTWRRMETKRILPSGTIIIDDYAHHPKEIRATLAAMKEVHVAKRIICVFQPHTHDRTLKLWDDFSAAFVDADLVVLAGVYDARPDCDDLKVDLLKLARDIAEKSSTKVFVANSVDEAKVVIEHDLVHAGDVLITMGAGDITALSDTVELP